MPEQEKEKYFRHFIRLATAIVGLSIVFPFIVNYCFQDWSKSGTFGDTFGALNAVFSGMAIAGIVVSILMQRKELDNQRIELALQRTEMQETRKEFLINRITNIIYSQLERYEKALEQFVIMHKGQTYVGYEAIFFLDHEKQITYHSADSEDPDVLKERKKKNCLAMTLYAANDKAIAQFALSAYNSVQVIKETLLKSDLPVDEINNLKNIFFRNLGFIQLSVLEDISEKFMEYLKFSTVENDNFINECKIEFRKLSQAHIFLKSIKEFRHTVITGSVITNAKEQWTQEFGAYA